jgi:hypothetical protein
MQLTLWDGARKWVEESKSITLLLLAHWCATTSAIRWKQENMG